MRGGKFNFRFYPEPLKNKRDENILFTVKSGPVVHYSKMSARQIAESPKFGAVSGDEVIDFVVPKENGEKVAIIELQEAFLTSNSCSLKLNLSGVR